MGPSHIGIGCNRFLELLIEVLDEVCKCGVGVALIGNSYRWNRAELFQLPQQSERTLQPLRVTSKYIQVNNDTFLTLATQTTQKS